MNRKYPNLIIMGFSILSLLMFAGCNQQAEEVQQNAEEQEGEAETVQEPEEEVATDDFSYDEENGVYYGNLVVSGYLDVQEMQAGFCDENCEVFDYAFFQILDTDNDVFDQYVEGQGGNSFIGDNSIGLGCVEDGILWRMNDSNEFGMQEYRNSAEESEAILNASAENPIKVQLERYLFTGGGGAPDCYSHFANVKIIE